jgi:hypothetical protein
MRPINKGTAPQCLRAFISSQLAIEPDPVNLTYDNFPHKQSLREILTAEQYGLCGYTGTPVDERIASYEDLTGLVKFQNHIEHLKCQGACREEVAARGLEYGRVLADDLQYGNLIAALEVRGAAVELFGAVAKKDVALPVLPTDENCAEKFIFQQGDGQVQGCNDSARASIEVLRLNHPTLTRWRVSALTSWLDPEVVKTPQDFEDVLRAVTTPHNGRLPEFAFVIEAITREYVL